MSVQHSGRSRLIRLGSGVVMAAGLSLGVAACHENASTEPESQALDAISASHAVNARTQTFTAQLSPLNGDVGYRPVHGVAKFKIKDGILSVKVNASGVQPGMFHAQHVHMLDSCPSADADGGDGILNFADGLPAYGGVLFWLDGNLEDPGNNGGLPNPQNAGGAETYNATGSVAALEAAVGQPLDLGNRVVVLHGVDPSTDLSADPNANTGSLPIACGPID